ncbi:hypothetical protein ACFS27_27990 [Promicromonospora vindobonensis]|uniref:DUF1795 domain-containing protein n=1 Tax=Promicromonospora vindobonensis TaxID=195748 RepID=A0ABW5W0K9_9MICO
MTEVKQIRIADSDMRIVLPGTWVRVPLDSEEVAVAFAKRLVKRQTGKADRLARARREAVQELVSSARDAVGIGVHTYLMSLEILPGIPFPAAMLLRDDEWPAESLPALQAGNIEEALTTGFPEVEVTEGVSGLIARRWEMVRQQVGEEEFMTMRLEYFLPYPDGAGLLMVRANMSNIPGGEPFATLFNEIVDSITFPAVVDEAADEAQGAVTVSPAVEVAQEPARNPA